MKSVLALFFGIFLLLCWGVVCFVASQRFDIHCGEYIHRAATANTIPLAKENLAKAITYLAEHHMTEGYTSVLYNSPSEDVGFLYQNLTQSMDVLNRVPASADELTVSNTLLKLHNSLTSQGEHGQSVITPDGISLFPDNTAFACLGIIGLVLAIGGGWGVMHIKP